jgi:hypothetical protein
MVLTGQAAEQAISANRFRLVIYSAAAVPADPRAALMAQFARMGTSFRLYLGRASRRRSASMAVPSMVPMSNQ